MSSQCYVLCPHCSGTGTVTLHSGPAPCIACVVVRCVPVQTLVAGAAALARELGRARLRLAALEHPTPSPPPPEPPPKVARERIKPIDELDPAEQRRMDAEYREWADRNGKGEGA